MFPSAISRIADGTRELSRLALTAAHANTHHRLVRNLWDKKKLSFMDAREANQYYSRIAKGMTVDLRKYSPDSFQFIEVTAFPPCILLMELLQLAQSPLGGDSVPVYRPIPAALQDSR